MTEHTTPPSPARRRALRAAAHHLNPVVSISRKGLTPSVLAEIDRCLAAHELIKLRLHGVERDDREALFDAICTALKCHTVQHIGNLVVLWRERPKDVAVPARVGRKKSEPATKKQAAARLEARGRK